MKEKVEKGGEKRGKREENEDNKRRNRMERKGK